MPITILKNGKRKVVQIFERGSKFPVAEFDDFEQAFRWICDYYRVEIKEIET